MFSIWNQALTNCSNRLKGLEVPVDNLPYTFLYAEPRFFRETNFIIRFSLSFFRSRESRKIPSSRMKKYSLFFGQHSAHWVDHFGHLIKTEIVIERRKASLNQFYQRPPLLRLFALKFQDKNEFSVVHSLYTLKNGGSKYT